MSKGLKTRINLENCPISKQDAQIQLSCIFGDVTVKSTTSSVHVYVLQILDSISLP